jgi:hypothetical protein
MRESQAHIRAGQPNCHVASVQGPDPGCLLLNCSVTSRRLCARGCVRGVGKAQGMMGWLGLSEY